MAVDPERTQRLLQESASGSREAVNALLPQLYTELKAQAARLMRRSDWASSLAPTVVVHEAYMRLVGTPPKDWAGKTHFVALAARVMRQVLVDHARERNAAKRGAGWERVTVSLADRLLPRREVDFLDLEELLQELGEEDERQARIVELRFFGGMTVPEIAAEIGVSVPTVEREWRHARAWLRVGLEGNTP